MTQQRDPSRAPNALSSEELAAEAAVDLPEREAMSTFGHAFGHGVDTDYGNFAMPINESTAANVNTSDSVAASEAQQTVIIYQTSDK